MKTTITCGTLIKMVKNYNVSLSGVSIEKESCIGRFRQERIGRTPFNLKFGEIVVHTQS